jgi:hypothetical protein
MKTLISIMTTNFHLGGAAKSGIQKRLDSRGDLLYPCGDEVRPHLLRVRRALAAAASIKRRLPTHLERKS